MTRINKYTHTKRDSVLDKTAKFKTSSIQHFNSSGDISFVCRDEW